MGVSEPLALAVVGARGMGDRPKTEEGEERSSPERHAHEERDGSSFSPRSRCGHRLDRGGPGRQGRGRTGAGRRRRRPDRLQGHPVRGAAGGRSSLEGTAAGGGLVWRAQRRQVRPGVRAVDGGPAAGRDERGLPVPERLDAGEVRRREAAGARLDLRRWLQRRRHVVPGARRREAGEARRRPREHRLPGRACSGSSRTPS